MSHLPINVLCLDDTDVVCESLERWFNMHCDFRWVGECKSTARLDEVVRRSGPDVVLLDLDLPETPANDMIAHLVEMTPRPRVLVLTSRPDARNVSDAMEAGADGYIVKELGMADIAAAVTRAVAHDAATPPRHRISRIGA